jgi:putative ABC transport system substrate-binding protein
LIAAFVQRLHELDWTNIAIELRWSEGSKDRLPEIVAEFVRLKVDVMVLEGSAATLAAKRTTSDIPIVFPVSGDPVSAGLVASLSRPGGNVTGLSLQVTDTATKRLEFLREVVPSLRRLAIMGDLSAPAVAQEISQAEQAAHELGVAITGIEIRQAVEIEPAFEALKGRVEALYVCSGPLFDTHRLRINELALGAKLPTSYEVQQYVAAGGLMSYGTNFADLFRRAAEIVDKILRGAKPADIPVEQPTKFDLVINLKTAKALGLTIPHKLLVLADEVIE